MSDSVRPHRRQPTRLPCPWDSPGKNTGVGCHFLLQCMKVKSKSEVTQSCLTLRDPMDCSLPGSSVHGIFQARVLEWGTIAFSKSSHTYCQFEEGFPGGTSGKESTCQCKRHKGCGFNLPWVGKIPWRTRWQPQVFFPGESPGQKSLVGYSPWGHKELDMTERLSDWALTRGGWLQIQMLLLYSEWFPLTVGRPRREDLWHDLWDDTCLAPAPSLPSPKEAYQVAGFRHLNAQSDNLVSESSWTHFVCLLTKSCLTLWPHGPSRLLCPWDSLGKNTGVGCHFLLQGIFTIQGLLPRLQMCPGSLPLGHLKASARHKGLTWPSAWIRRSLS